MIILLSDVQPQPLLFWSRIFVDVHHLKKPANLHSILHRRIAVWSTPQKCGCQDHCCIRVDFPMTAVERVKDTLGEGERDFPWKIQGWLEAESHGGLVKRWFFPFQLGEFQVPAVNFPGVYIYIYIYCSQFVGIIQGLWLVRVQQSSSTSWLP